MCFTRIKTVFIFHLIENQIEFHLVSNKTEKIPYIIGLRFIRHEKKIRLIRHEKKLRLIRHEKKLRFIRHETLYLSAGNGVIFLAVYGRSCGRFLRSTTAKAPELSPKTIVNRPANQAAFLSNCRLGGICLSS